MHLHCKLCHTSTTTDNRAKWMNTRFSETLWCIKTDLSFTTLLKNMTNVQEKETVFAMIQVANKYPHQSRVIYNLHLLWNILQSNGEIQTFMLTWSTIATFYRAYWPQEEIPYSGWLICCRCINLSKSGQSFSVSRKFSESYINCSCIELPLRCCSLESRNNRLEHMVLHHASNASDRFGQFCVGHPLRYCTCSRGGRVLSTPFRALSTLFLVAS